MENSKLVFLNELNNIDVTTLKLKSGIEIHQQLNCGKLFSYAPCKIVPNEELDKKIHRKLRFSKSEDGDIDKAAAHAFKQKNSFTYLYNNEIATLVDLDEEPPKQPNKLAVKTGLQIGLMMNLNFFKEIQFMRKLIIDGSITSGFQRTTMIGMGGKIQTKIGEIDIYGINIEEDSSRIISKEGKEHIFSLDRQGIPLIEITTGPNMKTPQEVQEVAKEIGNILRSFDTTRRGIGTIRQDLNVSIEVGNRVEIKGAQNLELIPKVVVEECKRQYIMHSIKEECNNRDINSKTLSDNKINNITSIFENTESKIILDGLKENNSKVLAIKLFNMKGLLGHEIQQNYRFASEISNRNKKSFPTIKGLFHSDELPKYNISQEEVDNIYKQLELDKSKDGFIILVHPEDIAKDSLKNILEITNELILGPQEEVRQVDPKGTQTIFLRPMPGSARMYPETDILPINILENSLNELKEKLPEKYDIKLKRLQETYNLKKEQIKSLFSKYNEDNVKELISSCELDAKEIYNIVIDLPKDIKKRDNIEPINFEYGLLKDLLTFTQKNKLNQQTIRDIIVSLYKKEISNAINIKEFIEQNNLIQKQLSKEEVRVKIKEIINKNTKAPFGALMGICMKELSKQTDGKVISEILKEEMDN